MIQWYVKVNQLLRDIRTKAMDAGKHLRNGDAAGAMAVKKYLDAHYTDLAAAWADRFPARVLGNIGRHIHFGQAGDYEQILDKDVPELEKKAEELLLAAHADTSALGFEQLLHPIVRVSAYDKFQQGHLRNAVLDAFTAVFDKIRERTGLTSDGSDLVGQAFSADSPRLLLSDLKTESGKNDQVGFLQIFMGAYKGIRNPKAHSLKHDLTIEKTAQYLIFASLLARRVEEAQVPA